MNSNQNHYKFVGRYSDKRQFGEQWGKCRIFGVYGIRAVGKSSFVKEFLKSKQGDIRYVDLSGQADDRSLLSVLCAHVHIAPDKDFEVTCQLFLEKLKEISYNKDVVLFFDDAEDFVEGPYKDFFLNICGSVVKHCTNVKVIITSTTRAEFARLRNIYYTHELKPLLPTESKSFLAHIAPNVVFGEYQDTIVELCEGLPLLLLMVGSELTLEDGLNPEDMVNLLLNSRLDLGSQTYSRDEHVGYVYTNFVLRLSLRSRSHLAMLDYIPGSFTAEQAKEILDIESLAIAKQLALKPIRIRHMLNYEFPTKRFNIQGIIREVIKANKILARTVLEGVRVRYCKTFARVMQCIAKKMKTSEYTKALSELALEHPNLRKLLEEVHCDRTKEESYHFFIEMASSCTELIEIYLASEGETFYKGCLSLAKQYGKTSDMATVLIARGSIETLTKGDLVKGNEYFNAALKQIGHPERSYPLAMLYQKLGWNTFKLGFAEEAIKYYNKSLEISVMSGEEFEDLTIQTLGYTGVAQVVMGNYDIAEKYHRSCLRRTKRYRGETHAGVGNVLNYLGVLYTQRGDHKTAMEYYRQGLELRQRGGAPIVIVYSLSNMANSYKLLGDFERAHWYADEAFDILNKQKLTLRDGHSLMYNTKGKIFAMEGKLKEAEKAFSKTVELTRMDQVQGYVFGQRLVNLAEVQEKRGRYTNSLRNVEETLSLSDKIIQTLPHNTILQACLLCMSKIYEDMGNQNKYRDTLLRLHSECIRLEQVCESQNDEQKLNKVYTVMANVKEQLNRP